MKSTDPLAATAAAFVADMAKDPRFVLVADGLELWGRAIAEGMTSVDQDGLLVYCLRSFIMNRENYLC